MSLTIAHGPLAGKPAATNYRIEGPARRLFFEDFPRHVRAVFAGETILDSRAGKLLHETSLLPQLYVPREDVRLDLCEATDHATHCPYKGAASYWSVRRQNRIAENAVWTYPEPSDAAPWLRGYLAVYWDTMDTWFDEDEEIQGHLRDPYHRVDVRESSRHVRVIVGGQLVAETRRPKVLSETGLPNRFYIAPEDVRRDSLEPSGTRTACPYKGITTYRTVMLDGHRIVDAAWVYEQPLENALKVRDHVCFLAGGVKVEVDGDKAA
ncbi:MAG: DUF427 domain-containing protein [Gammaproteobacteria bacterium]|nr:DUF427 domain-containing protein [Gammaproteobacteria bacterium]